MPATSIHDHPVPLYQCDRCLGVVHAATGRFERAPTPAGRKPACRLCRKLASLEPGVAAVMAELLMQRKTALFRRRK